MNKILRERINIDLTKIIGSYLLLNKRIKLKFYVLDRRLECIKDKLNNGYFFLSFNSTFTEKITCNNCKITFCKRLKEWTVRPKNYRS